MKSSERTIIRVKDLQEQGPSRFVLLPGGLDRVIIACEYFEVLEDVITVYGPDGPEGGPLFSAPIASGYVLLDRRLCDLETIETSLRRMHSDEQDAQRLHKELYGHEHDPNVKRGGDNLRFLRPSQHETEGEDGPFVAPEGDRPHPGQYL